MKDFDKYSVLKTNQPTLEVSGNHTSTPQSWGLGGCPSRRGQKKDTPGPEAVEGPREPVPCRAGDFLGLQGLLM